MGRRGTQAVYASSGGSPRPGARLASGCWPASTGWAPGPLGSSERFLRCFLHRFPPFPGLPWRKRAWPESPAVHLLAARAARRLELLDEAAAHLDACERLPGRDPQAARVERALL